MSDDRDLMDPAKNSLIPEEEESADSLNLELEQEAGEPAAEDADTNELLPEGPRAALIRDVGHLFAASLTDEADLGGGARLSRAASGLVVCQGGRIIGLARCSIKLLEKIKERLA